VIIISPVPDPTQLGISARRGTGGARQPPLLPGMDPLGGTLRLARSASPSNALLTTDRSPRQGMLFCATVAGQVPEAM
jgi:hypothetical protein